MMKMNRIAKIVIYYFCIFLTIVAVSTTAVASATVRDCAATWDPETRTLHIPSLIVGEGCFWADLRLVEMGFELADYGPSQVEDNCSATWDPETRTLHIPSLIVGGGCFWADLRLEVEGSFFKLADWAQCGLKYFGPAFNGGGNWQENLEKTSQFSNLAMVASNGNSVADIAFHDAQKIKAARRWRMKCLVVITDILFLVEKKDGVLRNIKLRSDCRQRMSDYVAYLKLFGCGEEICGWFYILDEPYWTAIQIKMPLSKMRHLLNKVILTVKEICPSSKTVGVIAITPQDIDNLGGELGEGGYSLPNFDLVGFDYYYTQAQQTLAEFERIWQEKYMENLKRFLLPGQKIVLIPGTFEFEGQKISVPVEDFLSLARFYWDRARTDSNVVAIVPFLWTWPEKNSPNKGLKDLPPEIQNAWREIGRKILRNARECPRIK